MTQSDAALIQRLEEGLAAVLGTVDRHSPLGEAQVAALETVLLLMRADRFASRDSVDDGSELMREALGAARATVVATGFALVRHRDAVPRPSA